MIEDRKPSYEFGINNLLLDADSYKASHSAQYPEGTTQVYSYIESRGGDFDSTLFFGLQMWLKKYLTHKLTIEQVDEAELVWKTHGEPFDREMWDYIVTRLNGVLPIEIRAVPEGTVIGNRNVLLTITNTDPRCAAVVSFLETALLRAVWYPTTVATNSYRVKKLLRKSFDDTSDDPAGIFFKLHDFGGRGVSSKESAGIGGAAHLVSFYGTDTMTAVQYARKYYNEPMAGFSIPAGEHSTVTTWGKDGEVAYLKNLIAKFGKPGALFACPIDSYNTWNFLDEVVNQCKEEIQASGGTLVVRPDSGNPLFVPLDVVDRIASRYGHTINSKGYKLLPSWIRVIQGDGITLETIPLIIKGLNERGYAIDNLAFGMGGGLLQHVNRDTYQFAMKASAVRIREKWIEVYKDPVDMPSKASKKGRFIVLKGPDGVYKTFDATEYDIARKDDLLQVVWKDGKLLRDQTFAEIRKNAEV